MVQSIEVSSLQNMSNQIIEEEVKFQSYILSFLYFLFHSKATYENPCEGLYISTGEWLELFLGCDLDCQSLLSVFFREKIVFDFFCRRVISYLQHLYIYTKISYSYVFLKKDHLSFSAQRKDIIFSGEKNIILPDNTRKIIFQRDFFGKIIFWGHLKKISYFHIFF